MNNVSSELSLRRSNILFRSSLAWEEDRLRLKASFCRRWHNKWLTVAIFCIISEKIARRILWLNVLYVISCRISFQINIPTCPTSQIEIEDSGYDT